MPTPVFHLATTHVANLSALFPVACPKKQVVGRYATTLLEAVTCANCLANPEAVAEAERLQLAFRRSLYASRLNCRGKVAAHKATGEDVSDCDEGLHCGLKHVGACNREGEDFDASRFASL
jgi:hypothetical protein